MMIYLRKKNVPQKGLFFQFLFAKKLFKNDSKHKCLLLSVLSIFCKSKNTQLTLNLKNQLILMHCKPAHNTSLQSRYKTAKVPI
jgi:hypothetical protein